MKDESREGFFHPSAFILANKKAALIEATCVARKAAWRTG